MNGELGPQKGGLRACPADAHDASTAAIAEQVHRAVGALLHVADAMGQLCEQRFAVQGLPEVRSARPLSLSA